MSRIVLVIVAHPDDEAFGIAGTMARLRQEGHTVTVLCATRGEAGEISDPALATRETLGAVREQELRDAMAVLNVDDVRFLDYRDSGMAGTPENDDPRALYQAEPLGVVMELVALMQEVNPDVVITWDPTGGYGHPDHIRVHETAKEAFDSYAMRSGRPVRLYYLGIPPDLFQEMAEELRAQGIQFVSDEMMEELRSADRLPITTEIDVSPHVEQKRQAIRAHRSQIPPDSPFDRLSESLRARFYGREYFHRAAPPWQEGEPREAWLWPADA